MFHPHIVSYTFLSSDAVPFLHKSCPHSPAFSVIGMNTGISEYAQKNVTGDDINAMIKDLMS